MIIEAYCIVCKKSVSGQVKEFLKTDSGKWLYVGNCSICFYEIKRIKNEAII